MGLRKFISLTAVLLLVIVGLGDRFELLRTEISTELLRTGNGAKALGTESGAVLAYYDDDDDDAAMPGSDEGAGEGTMQSDSSARGDDSGLDSGGEVSSGEGINVDAMGGDPSTDE